METVIEPILRLAQKLSTLPGIGRKTAQRLAYFIVGQSEGYAEEFAQAVLSAKHETKFCSICGTFTDVDPCAICSSERASEQICVVKDPRDVLAMEKTHEFKGHYHVLHGVISPMDGVGPDDLRLEQLVLRVKAGAKEVILATNPDVEGEATATYIANLLKPLGARVTRIAHGVPVGGNLEYTDELTLAHAFYGRREM